MSECFRAREIFVEVLLGTGRSIHGKFGSMALSNSERAASQITRKGNRIFR